jgi:transcription elongation factor Elf1
MLCIKCNSNGVGKRRVQLGHRVCKPCGEVKAQEARKAWCVIQSYGKGNYQYVTPTTAVQDLLNTNQKEVRGTL